MSTQFPCRTRAPGNWCEGIDLIQRFSWPTGFLGTDGNCQFHIYMYIVYIYMCLYLSEPFSWLRWGLTDRTCPCISSLGWILKNKVAPVSTSLIAMDRCQVYWIISITVGLQKLNIFPPRIRVLGNYIHKNAIVPDSHIKRCIDRCHVLPNSLTGGMYMYLIP